MSDEIIRRAAIDALDECDCAWALTGRLADAVIAAVTPLIRRQAIEDAADALRGCALQRRVLFRGLQCQAR